MGYSRNEVLGYEQCCEILPSKSSRVKTSPVRGIMQDDPYEIDFISQAQSNSIALVKKGENTKSTTSNRVIRKIQPKFSMALPATVNRVAQPVSRNSPPTPLSNKSGGRHKRNQPFAMQANINYHVTGHLTQLLKPRTIYKYGNNRFLTTRSISITKGHKRIYS